MFQRGEYEDSLVDNSTFEDGDWNGDGAFDSQDLVLAFPAGTYESAAAASLDPATLDRLFARLHRQPTR